MGLSGVYVPRTATLADQAWRACGKALGRVMDGEGRVSQDAWRCCERFCIVSLCFSGLLRPARRCSPACFALTSRFLP